MTNTIKEKPKKILILQQRQLGDVLLATPVLSALKKAFPDSLIDFFTEKKCLPILENNPHLSNTVTVDKKEHSTFFSQLAFYKDVAKNNYDIVISMQNLPRCLMQVFFSKAKYRIGMKEKVYKNFFYTHTIKQTSTYSSARKLDLLAPLGIKSHEDAKPEIYLKDKEKEKALEILKKYNFSTKENLIIMDTTHRDIRRTYPRKYFAQLIEYINKNIPNAVFYFFRAPNEEEQVQECIDLLSDDIKYIFPEVCPDIRISTAIMSHAVYHIGNCSFPRHLAVALDIPSSTMIAFKEDMWDFQSNKHLTFSIDLDCQPCTNRKCRDPKCLTELYPELIQDKIIEHIKEVTS